MAYTIAIQMDDIATVNPLTDTTVLLGSEACARGHKVYHYHPRDLSFKNGEIIAKARKTTFRNDPKDYYSVSEWEYINLADVNVVLIRQDPPFDMAYLTATYILERLTPHTLVLNDPFEVRNSPEKLFMFDFPKFVPPTLISRDISQISAFLDTHKDIVLKPLYGYAGQSIFRLKHGDTNFHSLLEMFFGTSKEPIIAQIFLPDIATMDKRIIVIDGKVSAFMGRVPASGDIRANMRVGGNGVHITPTARDIEIGETIATALHKKNILLAGIDVIGSHLTEINVTCPTGLVRSNLLYGLTQEKTFWDAVERRL